MTRANPDYSDSAVNLVNPSEVKEALLAQKNRLLDLAKLQEKIDNCIPAELSAELECLQQEIAAEDKGIRGYIDTFGSYQDVENGHYALKQRAVTVSYDPKAVHQHLETALVAACIVESVDKATVEALVKAGRITGEQQKAISQEKETYRFVIR
ncbi:MAG: hypothetical protein WC455_15845 [Dehalococcoidia bacterium]